MLFRSAAAGVVTMVGFNYRFLPAVRLARRWIAEGRLGRIYHFRARFADASFLDPAMPFAQRGRTMRPLRMP